MSPPPRPAGCGRSNACLSRLPMERVNLHALPGYTKSPGPIIQAVGGQFGLANMLMTQVLADAYGCEAAIEDADALMAAAMAAAAAVSATVVGESTVRY